MIIVGWILSAGEALFDFVSKDADNLKSSRTFDRIPGGSPMNVALALSRLGDSVRFLGKLSSDPFGTALKEFMDSEGIDTSLLRFSHDHKTSLAFVASDKNGVPDYMFYRENTADMNLKLDEVSLDPGNFSIYHFGSIALASGETSKTLLKIFDDFLGRVLISFDPNIRTSIIKSKKEYLERIDSVLRYSDIVKLSRDDMEYIIGSSDVEKFVEIYERKDKITILTKGADGSILYKDGKIHHQDALNFGKIVDTAGCGDAFIAGFLHIVNQDGTNWKSLKKALRFASAIAGIVATKAGADMPTLIELKKKWKE